jgi:hypothetical protein
MHEHICPRCGMSLAAGAYWELLPAPPDRLPAYRLRHQRDGGGTCIAYAGPTLRERNVTADYQRERAASVPE